MPYQEEELTTDSEIKKSYWWVTHLIEIKKKIVRMIIAAMIIWLFSVLIFAVFIFLVQRDQDIELRTTLRQQASSYGVPAHPDEIIVDNIGALAGSAQSFDLYASVQNPNQNWWLTFTYQFVVDDKPLEERSSFIFPSDQKYVLFLAQTIPNNAKIDFRLISKKWHRITKKEQRLLEEHHRFNVSNIQYTPSEQTGTGFAVPISSLTFTVKNQSPFPFPEVTVPIIAKQDDSVVAIAQIPLYAMRPEEERTRSVQWFHSFSQPTLFDIRPTVNVLR